ncbi:unnamed protein product [Brassica oleracea]
MHIFFFLDVYRTFVSLFFAQVDCCFIGDLIDSFIQIGIDILSQLRHMHLVP